jgi:CubicO group peptidase (beta-lactamase class C family)
MRSFIALCGLFTVLVFHGWTESQPGLGARVDRYLAPYVRGRNFTGAVLIAEGGRVLVDRAYGDADYGLGVANTTQTRFHIASVSKAFTAAAVLMLEKQGKLKTSDKVSVYVPDFPHGDEISLLNLLTHTSGITNVNDLPEYERAQRFPQTPASLVELFKDKPLDFSPGTRYAYSNSNYNLLALIIERVSKQTYSEFLRERIFAPLGLKNTGDDNKAGEIIAGSASGFEPAGVDQMRRAPYLDWSAKTGNGSLYSTTGDLLKFVSAYADGRVAPQEALERVWAEKPGNNYGWFVRRRNDELAIGTNGRSPGFTSSVEYYPSRKLTVIVLSNSYSPVSQSPIAEDLAAMALGREVELPRQVESVAVAASELTRDEGSYKFGADFYRPGAVVMLRVKEGAAVLDWGNQFITELVPVAKGEFLDRTLWARIAIAAESDQLTYSSGGREFRAKRLVGK